MAMSNVILTQRGITTNLQVWDEPFNCLSGTGHDDALELLYEQAHGQGKQVWLIDHHSVDFGFDGVLTVVKNHSGSHLAR